MKDINLYITEKFKINKDIQNSDEEEKNYIHPDSPEAKELCKSFKSDNVMYCKYENGRNNVGLIKLMTDNEHFYIKPATTKSITEKLPTDANISFYTLKDLVNIGLGDSYIINKYHSKIDSLSRVNNLKRIYHSFYFGELGMIFKDSKEANKCLKEAKNNYKLSGSSKYKVMTIEEAASMKSSIYGNSIGEIYFIS